MASSSSSSHLQIFLLLLTFSAAQISTKPDPFVVPVNKDASTLQYLATIRHGTPLSSATTLVLDLNAPLVWLDCHSAPGRRIVPRASLDCLAATPLSRRDGVSGRCDLSLENAIGRVVGRGDLAEGVVAVDSAGRSTVRLLFGCAAARSMLRGLAGGARGMLGLGRGRVSLPSQVSSDRQFTVCLSSSNGVVVVEDGYSSSYFGREVSKSMVYTPLLSEESTQKQGYFVDLKSIEIGGKKLAVDIETAKLSTTVAYTKMRSPIYAVFAEAYAKAAAAMNMRRVESAEGPLGVCYGAEAKGPEMDLVMQSELVKWRVRSLVRVGGEGSAVCLGVLDGGPELEASIVLGGHQLEETVLHFDVGNSRLGFSPLSKWHKTCSHFDLSHDSI